MQTEVKTGRGVVKPVNLDEMYWSQLKYAPLAIELPVDRSRPSQQTLTVHRYVCAWPMSLRDQAQGLGRELQAELSDVVLAAYATLLHRYSRQEELVIGLDGAVPLYLNLEEELSFAQLVSRLQEAQEEARRHAGLTAAEMTEALGLDPDPSRHPLFQVTYEWQSDPAILPRTESPYELSLLVSEGEGDLLVGIEYNAGLFESSTVMRIADQLRLLLEGAVAHPDESVLSLPMVTTLEREWQREWNRTERPWDSALLVNQLFERQVERTPHEIALAAGDVTLSYRELNERANRLASYLREKGVGPDVLVGVLMERTADLIVALLAVLKAGGAYVPIDPNYPADRVTLMIEDSQVAVLITQSSTAAPQRMEQAVQVVYADSPDGQWLSMPSENLPAAASPEHLAYVIFTSGSTGHPKGVSIRHRNLNSFLHWARDVYAPDVLAGVLAGTSVCFDLSVFEIFAPLSWGGKVILVQDGLSLGQMTAVDGVTLLNTVPSVASELVRMGGIPESVRVINLAGEALRNSLAQQLYALPWVEKVYNLYGPTEDTIYSTFALVEKGAAVEPTIGRPLSNTQVYLLDSCMEPVPVGVPGELFLSGAGLARGYLHREDLTNERFVSNPFSGQRDQRMYRTGDLARYRADGEIEYLGRLDHQVKVRGFRIELGEIEAALLAHAAAHAAVVLVREDQPGVKGLIAYVAGDKQALNIEELRAHLARTLPRYMIPTAFVILDVMPMTPNGKVDRKALPAPIADNVAGAVREYVAPRTEIEKRVAEVFASVLRAEDIGLHDDFFVLGGDSLRAAQVLTRLRHLQGVTLTQHDFFQAPTVAELADRLAAAAEEPRIEVIQRREAGGEVPLSFAQERMWFLQELHPESGAYNVPVYMTLRGNLDVEVLKESLEAVVERHQSLGIQFLQTDGVLVQVRRERSNLDWTYLDKSDLPDTEREETLQRLALDSADEPFDLRQGQVLRVVLTRVKEAEHRLLLVMHHIVTDGWSLTVFLRELSELYASRVEGRPAELTELSLQYGDYALWHRDLLAAEGETLLQYWEQQLAGSSYVLELPADFWRPPVQSFRGARYRFSIDRELTAALKRLTQQEGATLFMTLLAGFQTLLSRWTGESDLLIGTPAANRTRAEFEDIIGFFVNTLVMRARLSDDQSFRSFLQQVKETALQAYAHQELPLEQLVNRLLPDRDPSRNPLFQVLFALQNTEAIPKDLGGLSVEPLDMDTRTAMVDIALVMTESEQGITAEIDYSTDLFEADTIERMMSQFDTLLRAIAADPDARLGDLPLLTEVQRRQILIEWNCESALQNGEEAVHRLVERIVQQQPQAVAATFEADEITYRELDERANQLARYLIASGLQREDLVGISLERSLAQLVAVLAVLKAGGAYVPMDPMYPADRLQYMLADAKPKYLLTESHLREKWATAHDVGTTLLFPHEMRAMLAEQDRTAPPTDVQADQLAYIIYTSGSTGKPKAVMVPHRGLINVALSAVQMFALNRESRVLQFASLSFDASVWEIFMALLSGASLHLATMDNLVAVVKERSVTAGLLPPAVLSTVSPDDVPSLRTIISGGEPCSADIVTRWAQAAFYNAYGPTEASVCATVARCEPDGREPSIGRAVPGARLYVLDARLQLVPVGVPGELYIGGIGVARGYLNRPDLTAERFVQDPFVKGQGARMYRTGDLVRYDRNGELRFIGRLDNQVKIRGLRIELGEIESVIASHVGVLDAVVTVQDLNAEDKVVAAYYVAADERVGPIDLHTYASTKLPHFMVPAAFVKLDHLPLTPNGKVNVKALPVPNFSIATPQGELQLPQNETEQQIADMWCEILQIKEVSTTEDFFMLGGHSLRATQVTSRIREQFGVNMLLTDFFKSPTIAGLAQLVQSREQAVEPSDQIPKAHRGRDLPLSFTQERLWFVQSMEPESAAYNIPVSVRLQGELDVEVLRRSLTAIIERHEVLRTVYRLTGESPAQVVLPEWTFEWEVSDLSELEPEAAEDRLREVTEALFHQVIDIESGLPFRMALVRISDGDHRLLMNFHHIAFDGWSLGVLFKELGALYEGMSKGQSEPLAPLALQYPDYAVWQRETFAEHLDEQMTYWRDHLQGMNGVLELPSDRPRPPVPTHRGARHLFTVPSALADSLREWSRQESVTLYMTLLTSFKILLARLSGERDIAVGTPIANRTRTELEDLIGFFVNTLIMRTKLSDKKSFRELLHEVQTTALGAFSHQDIPFERLVEELQPERDLSRNPLFQVMFNMLNVPSIRLQMDDLTAEVYEDSGVMSKFDLTLYARELDDDSLEMDLVYNTDLFNEQRMAEFGRQLLAIMEQVIADPDRKLKDLSLRTAGSASLLPSGVGELAAVKELPVASRLTQTAKLLGDRIAAVDAEGEWSYRQLESRTNRLARYLLANGLKRGDVVAVFAQRSATLLGALLGIHKAGGAFMILDPSYPAARLTDCFDLVKPRALLQIEGAGPLPVELAERAEKLICRLVLRGDGTDSADRLSSLPDEPPAVEITADDTAYIAFTSGTTGKPKGIIGTHGPLSHFLRWHTETFEITAADRFALIAGLAHDPLLRDLFTGVYAGATLAIPHPDDVQDSKRLREFLMEKEITILHLTPAMGTLIGEGAEAGRFTSLRLACFGGDMLTANDVRDLQLLAPKVRCVNFYGATETPQAMGYAEVDGASEKARLPVGRGIDGVELLIIGEGNRLLGVGELGEVYIRTPYLSKGYLQDERNTRTKYIANPFTDDPSDRLYRTGDLGRYLPDGQVELVGRSDRQVKVRGYRIELEEIEAVISRHREIWDTVVMLREDRPGDKQLVAYAVAPKLGEVKELRTFLQEHLPGYMVPSAILLLENIPLTPNGKVDLPQLPAPEQKKSDAAVYEPPRNETEAAVAEIWKEVLGGAQISIFDNFFEIGGHSLKVIRVLSHVREQFGVDLPLRSFFEAPTVASLADVIALQREELLNSDDLDQVMAQLRIMAGGDDAKLQELIDALLSDEEEEDQ